MRRHFIKLQYDGSAFHGWQRQENSITVQGELERTFKNYFKSNIDIVGCGRTDTGVHAHCYFAHFDYDLFDYKAFLNQINLMLPDEIALLSVFKVEHDAHARYDAFDREYQYKMVFMQDPFLRHNQYYFPYTKKPDIVLMNKAAALIKEGKDFVNFSKVGSDIKSNICHVYQCEWHREYDELKLTISANRFLRGMVRLIVGACINVGLNKIFLSDIKNALHHDKALPFVWSVPAEGLSLTNVKYPFNLD